MADVAEHCDEVGYQLPLCAGRQGAHDVGGVLQRGRDLLDRFRQRGVDLLVFLPAFDVDEEDLADLPTEQDGVRVHVVGLALVHIAVGAGDAFLLEALVGAGGQGPVDLVRPAELMGLHAAVEPGQRHVDLQRRPVLRDRLVLGGGHQRRPVPVGGHPLLELLGVRRGRGTVLPCRRERVEVDRVHVRLRRDLLAQRGQIPDEVLDGVPLGDRACGEGVREQLGTGGGLFLVHPAEVAHLLLRQQLGHRPNQPRFEIGEFQPGLEAGGAVQHHPVQQARPLRSLHPPFEGGGGHSALQPLTQPLQTLIP
ncbi:hypothetical protein LE181_07750 [Streptomyces sp. SCA3-4]|uniref:hypothetical protein n=1 Tax=Streptomyces sichuanensis TaxID=2871810 RepID=UPI001CE2993A|nr:hypothetical protein [Streptomyces sichuanensis]MCA6092056.1 hypothetical protein [Streptomyces sichuanensis]